MIVYFADRRMHILGMASTALRDGMAISDDTRTEDIETASVTFEFDLHYTGGPSRHNARNIAKAGNYLLRTDGQTQEFYCIITTEESVSDHTIDVYCESAGLDMLNEEVAAFKADQAYTIEWYVKKYAYDSGFEIGVNEDPSSVRTLSWDSTATATERLQSVATEFGDEIYFSFAIQGLSVKHKYINIKKRRGRDQNRELRQGRDFDDMTIKTSIEDLATALVVTGGTPESSDGSDQQPITLSGYKYDDGDIYVDGVMVKSRKALAVWSRYIDPDETGTDVGHVVKQWSYDTTSQSELCSRAVSHLKKVCEPEVTYELELSNLSGDIEIGDSVYIIDKAAELYFKARLIKLETSESTKTRKATFGNFLAL